VVRASTAERQTLVFCADVCPCGKVAPPDLRGRVDEELQAMTTQAIHPGRVAMASAIFTARSGMGGVVASGSPWTGADGVQQELRAASLAVAPAIRAECNYFPHQSSAVLSAFKTFTPMRSPTPNSRRYCPWFSRAADDKSD
jgi:hypothetical protein